MRLTSNVAENSNATRKACPESDLLLQDCIPVCYKLTLLRHEEPRAKEQIVSNFLELSQREFTSYFYKLLFRGRSQECGVRSGIGGLAR